jgi:hypothetical protein
VVGIAGSRFFVCFTLAPSNTHSHNNLEAEVAVNTVRPLYTPSKLNTINLESTVSRPVTQWFDVRNLVSHASHH